MRDNSKMLRRTVFVTKSNGYAYRGWCKDDTETGLMLASLVLFNPDVVRAMTTPEEMWTAEGETLTGRAMVFLPWHRVEEVWVKWER